MNKGRPISLINTGWYQKKGMKIEFPSRIGKECVDVNFYTFNFVVAMVVTVLVAR